MKQTALTPVRAWLLALPLSLAAGMARSEAPQENEKPLTAVEARRHVGETILVQIEVRAAKDRLEKRGEIYLDSEGDFRDEKNFAVVITRRGAESLAAIDVRDPAEHFRGKVIRARGMVKEVEGVPRIEVDDVEQIRLVENP